LNTIIIEKITDFIRFVGSGACHQNPQLSFFDGSSYMAVCSRCTGIYIGFISSIIVILVLERKVKTSVPSFKITMALIIFAFFMGLDWLGTTLRIIEPNNYTRLITGYLVGWFIAILLLPLKNSVIWKTGIEKQYLDNKLRFILWIASGVVIILLFYFTYKEVLFVWSLLLSAGEILLISYLLLILVFALSRKLKNTVTTLSRYSLFLAAGIFISIGFLALSAFLKTLIG
jgi:uncharacterized membrane protein